MEMKVLEETGPVYEPHNNLCNHGQFHFPHRCGWRSPAPHHYYSPALHRYYSAALHRYYSAALHRYYSAALHRYYSVALHRYHSVALQCCMNHLNPFLKCRKFELREETRMGKPYSNAAL